MYAEYRFIEYYDDRPPQRFAIPCQIVGSTAKSFKIRLLKPTPRWHKNGETIWVRKKSVWTPTDNTGQWWND